MPTPLFKKLIATIAIGFLCVLFGGIYFVATKDTIFFILSTILFTCCLIKSGFLYRIIKKRNYISLSGTCIEIKHRPLRQTTVVTFQLDDDSTYELALDRVMKLRKNARYELFFEVSRKTNPQQAFHLPMQFLCLEELS